jgi:hypothetical protein
MEIPGEIIVYGICAGISFVIALLITLTIIIIYKVKKKKST